MPGALNAVLSSELPPEASPPEAPSPEASPEEGSVGSGGPIKGMSNCWALSWPTIPKVTNIRAASVSTKASVGRDFLNSESNIGAMAVDGRYSGVGRFLASGPQCTWERRRSHLRWGRRLGVLACAAAPPKGLQQAVA